MIEVSKEGNTLNMNSNIYVDTFILIQFIHLNSLFVGFNVPMLGSTRVDFFSSNNFRLCNITPGLIAKLSIIGQFY